LTFGIDQLEIPKYVHIKNTTALGCIYKQHYSLTRWLLEKFAVSMWGSYNSLELSLFKPSSQEYLLALGVNASFQKNVQVLTESRFLTYIF